MYEIQFRGKGGCQRAAFVQGLLEYMGAVRLWNPRDDLRIIFDKQEDFKSRYFHIDYKLPASKGFLFFCKWIYLTFKYDNIDDVACIQFDGSNKQAVQAIVNKLGLLQQTTPNELKEKVANFAEIARLSDPSQPIEVVEVATNGKKRK